MASRDSQQLRRNRGWSVKQSRTVAIVVAVVLLTAALLYHGRSYTTSFINRGSGGATSTSTAQRREHGFSNTRRDVCSDNATTVFTADEKSLSQHKVPQWFERARFGIFIHWGLYSVPGWAETKHSFADFKTKVTPQEHFMHNPYSEWYLNTVRMNQAREGKADPGGGDNALAHHRKAFGGEDPAALEPGQWYYARFARAFNDGLKDWQPQRWAELFRQSGAGYVVLTTKHHDGFCLWPTEAKHPGWRQFAGKHGLNETHVTRRDLVGELSRAVRAAGLQMGLYYSGGLDWSFRWQLDACFDVDATSSTAAKCHPDVPASEEYARYAGAQLKELMAYKPAILWNDIDWPAPGKHNVGALSLPPLFAAYFNSACPRGVVNDRWHLNGAADDDAKANAARWSWTGDFGTPEYGDRATVQARLFETCRGIGKSFGFNRAEEQSKGCAAYMSAAQVVELLVATAAKNGNLLLDVGPDERGRVPACQARVLRGVGAWLASYGRAVLATVPFLPAGAAIDAGDPVRYLAAADGAAVYAVVLAGTVRRAPPGEKQRYVTLLDAAGAPRLSDEFRREAAVWLPDGDGSVLVATEREPGKARLTVFLPFDEAYWLPNAAWVIEFSRAAPADAGREVLDCRKMKSCATLARK